MTVEVELVLIGVDVMANTVTQMTAVAVIKTVELNNMFHFLLQNCLLRVSISNHLL